MPLDQEIKSNSDKIAEYVEVYYDYIDKVVETYVLLCKEANAIPEGVHSVSVIWTLKNYKYEG